MDEMKDYDVFIPILNEDKVYWIYHNLDAASGDQFVVTVLTEELVRKLDSLCSVGKINSIEEITEYVVESGSQIEQFDPNPNDIFLNSFYERIREIYISYDRLDICLMNPASISEIKSLFDVKAIVNSYMNKELDLSCADYGEIRKIGLAHTTTEDGEYQIDTEMDLLSKKVTTYIDGTYVAHSDEYDSYSQMAYCLSEITFDELVYIPDSDWKGIVAEQLSERVINCLDNYNHDKLENYGSIDGTGTKEAIVQIIQSPRSYKNQLYGDLKEILDDKRSSDGAVAPLIDDIDEYRHRWGFDRTGPIK